MLDTNLFSLRFRAIFTYAQRLLRPIWDMNITQRQCQSHPIDKQTMATEAFEPVLLKLQNLLNMIEACHGQLLYQYSSEDQARLLGQDIDQAQAN